MSNWIDICDLTDITPGTGVCALVEKEHVAIFRPFETDELYAINNIDPFAHASVLSRGIIGQNNDELYVASPLKKQRFRLVDGICLDDAKFSIKSYEVRVTKENLVQVKSNSN